MSLTFEQIIHTAYRTNFLAGQITLTDYGDGNGLVISTWNVPGVTQPTHSAVMALDTPSLETLFNFYTFIDTGEPLLVCFIDSVAQQKQFDNAISCSSYANSTNLTWKAQALAFIAWRDAVYNYVIAQESLMQNGTRTIPTFAAFQLELPVIVWPI